MILTGYWYPAGSSLRCTAELQLEKGGFRLFLDGEPPRQDTGGELEFSPRVGGIPRKIQLPDGSVFTTQENDRIDAWLSRSGHKNAHQHWMHALESNWTWVGVALLFTTFFVFVGLYRGLPWASKKIAFKLPAEAIQAVSSGTLQTLDRLVFEPSGFTRKPATSPPPTFSGPVPDDREGFSYALHFRQMSSLGDDTRIANAFALPSGDILVTDRLVELAKKPEELNAILLHEIGHVVHWHGMRQIIQSSALTIILMLVIGDVGAVEEWTLALPGFLLESNYSRGFETEADEYAFKRMIAMDRDPVYFGHMLGRITGEGRGAAEDKAVQDPGSEGWLRYLSSHPGSPTRVEQARRYSEIFNAGRLQ